MKSEYISCQTKEASGMRKLARSFIRSDSTSMLCVYPRMRIDLDLCQYRIWWLNISTGHSVPYILYLPFYSFEFAALI